MEVDFTFFVRIILEVVESGGVIHQIIGGGKRNGRVVFEFCNFCYVRVLNSRNWFVICDWVRTKLEIVA